MVCRPALPPVRRALVRALAPGLILTSLAVAPAHAAGGGAAAGGGSSSSTVPVSVSSPSGGGVATGATSTTAKAAGRRATVATRRGVRTLAVRAGRGTGSRLTTLPRGRRVTATCRATGRLARGTQGSSRTWLKVRAAGRTGWIPAASARVGGGARSVSRCGAATSSTRTPSSTNATVRVGRTGLALRTSPTLGGTVRSRLADGARVAVSCHADGDDVSGSKQWAKVAAPAAGWVHGSYLRRDGGTAIAACAAGDLPPAASTVPTPTTPTTGSGASNNGGQGACVRTPTVAATGRFATQAAFVAAAAPAAQRSQRETGVPASVTIAQAILESGWGNSHLGANNFFGIKATKAGSAWRWGANAVGCVIRRTAEQTSAGRVYQVDAGFRMYRSMADSFVDHGSFLRDNGRYKPAFSHTGDAKRFATEIWRAGYATDTKYPGKLHDLMDRFSLQRYDRG